MHRTDLTLDECALFKVRSPRHLAEILLINHARLYALIRRGKRNYREFAQGMGDGKPSRWVECPNELLMQVQRRIHRLLAQMLPPAFLHSGVKGRSAITNAINHFDCHEDAVPVVKLDIAKFFPSSDGHRVYWFFYQTLQCSSEVSKYLCSLTTTPATSTSDHLHLPTGGATSQILAYYCYQEMFSVLAKLATDNNAILGVFVDDIVLSGPGATRRLLNEARMIIQRYGLRSKRIKEKAWRISDTKLITGVALTRQGIKLPNSRRLNIHQLQQGFHRACAIDDRIVLARRLLGALFSAGQIEERYTRQGHVLLRKLKQDTSIWTAMRKQPKQNPDYSSAAFRDLAGSWFDVDSSTKAESVL